MQTSQTEQTRTARPRAALATLGCRLSQAETSMLADQLRRKGYEIVPEHEAADLFVLNTCSVTEQAEKDCRYAVRRALRRSPDTFVAVTGCYAQTGVETLRTIPGIDLLVGTDQKMRLPDLLPLAHDLHKRETAEVRYSRAIDRTEFSLPGTAYTDATRALLKIQDGCNDRCSFCLIPSARGAERSRALDDVLREAEALLAVGHRELVLTGVNIGRYQSQGHTLAGLIRRLDQLPGAARIRISSIEPTTVTDELLELLNGSRLCRYLHVPLQSGSDRILTAMRRHYGAQDYRRVIERAVAICPEVGLGTDVMVGFPGETEQDFADTRLLLSHLPMSYFHVFSFSARPGTAAARMAGSITDSVIAARRKALVADSATRAAAFHHNLVGTQQMVLFEKRVERGMRMGTSDHFAHVAVPAEQAEAHQLACVRITAAAGPLAFGEVVTDAAVPVSISPSVAAAPRPLALSRELPVLAI
ncbi:MAG: tRNA (N(6)-L-threonylcarbamoyladenosine(37)-C(2))-methylthiotransferase MtaB [Nitrospiraceae bacterium]